MVEISEKIDYAKSKTAIKLEKGMSLNEKFQQTKQPLESSDEKNTLNQIKYVLTETALNTTAHAIPNIIRSKLLVLKLLWFISLLISSGGCAYLMYRTIASYLEFEVVTKISINREIPSLFPTVTICENLSVF